ncbi:MAG: preprotein translocase subunit YajC [Eubacteriales bacterium]|nr:preprotein translocase subunit YajC [Eubacteriales bacterium]
MLLYMGAFLVIMYLLIFLPQKKRDKKAKQMLEAMAVGDQVTSIGGISGTVVNIKEDEITIETSVEKTQVNFKKWAIKEVNTVKSE